MGSKKYPKPGGTGYVNVVLDVETANTLLVALNYALGIDNGKKKKKKKKKKPEKKQTAGTPKPSPKSTPKPKPK